jgi:O-antigen ligase
VRPEIGPSACEENVNYFLLLLTWFFVLFHPLRMLNQYVGGVSSFYWLQSLLLASLLPFWIQGKTKRTNYTLLMLLVLLHVASTLFVAENTGFARKATRMLFEGYLLGLMTLAFGAEKKRMEALFRLFVLSFIYYAIWGIQGKGEVRWDYVLDDSNQFGTYMGMGVALSICYLGGQTTGKGKLLGLAGTVAGLLGAVASFSRGSFLALTVTFAFLWVKAKRKFAFTIAGGLGVFLLFIAANQLYPGGTFWQEMETILTGTSTGTGLDRKVLWGIGWAEFKGNPILGVGVHNFSVLAPEYAGEEAKIRYPDLRTLWGRSPHNIYFQVLAEQGIAGVALFLALLVGFWKENRGIRRARRPFLNEEKSGGADRIGARLEAGRYTRYADGILVSIICYLCGGFFYPIYEYHWLWSLMIMNRLIKMVVSDEIAKLQADDSADPLPADGSGRPEAGVP